MTSAALLGMAHSFAAEISIDAANFKNACSPLLYGACIEDVNHEIYGGLYDQRLYGESFEEPATATTIFGWAAYDGNWQPAGASVAVNAVAGAKLVRDQPQFADGTVEFDLRFTSPGTAANNAGAIVRVQNSGVGADAFNGYEISLAADGASIVLGRHQQNFALLKSAAVAIDPTQWQHLRVVLAGARVQVYLNDGAAAVIDYVDANPLPAGSMGLRTWGAAAEFRNFKSVAGGQEMIANFQAVPASIVGWPAFGGAWQPNHGSGVAATANQGAKIVQDQPQFADGTVEFDLRFTAPMAADRNAGAIVRVKNAGVGADAFDGYEISLAANGTSLALGRHQQNFALLQTAPVSVDATQWQHLRVVTTGGRVQVYLNGAATAAIDYVDANPLPAGSVGLRTWGSNVEFRDFKSGATGGEITAAVFSGVPVANVSGQWDAVTTGGAQGDFATDAVRPFNGARSQKMVFTGGTGMVGVANRGLNRWGVAVKNGSVYSGRVYLRGSGLQGAVTVSLQSADGSRTYASQALTGVAAGWAKFPFSLTSSADDPNARFLVSIDAPGTLWIDQAVLLGPPDARFAQVPVRTDIADAMTAGKLSFLRYGGTAVNVPEYRFKKMIGDPDLRPPYQGNWHPYTSNGFGIEEFIRYCEAVKIEPAFAINVEETPQDMADMVEYLNGAATTAWGSKRAANGHPAPYGVKYIELGNEEVIWGDIAADYDHYIERFKLLAAAMKKVDPNLVFINAAWWRGNNPNCERVFKALEGWATYWDFHFWADDANSGIATGNDLDQARQLFQQWVPGAKMKVVIFEENGNSHNLQRALGHATTLNAVRRHGDFVAIDCEANGLQPWLQNDNGWDQGHIFFTPDQVWGMPPYYAQQMAAANHQPKLVGSVVTGSTDLDVTATKSDDGKTLCLHVVNIGSGAVTTRLTLANFPQIDPVAKSWTLSGNPGDANTPQNPTAIQPVTREFSGVSNDFSYSFSAHSYTVLRFTAEVGTAANDRATEYAISGGLSGANAEPAADADGDGLDNFAEWAFGTDPLAADGTLANAHLTFTSLLTDGFRFRHRRLIGYQEAGISYVYQASGDLLNWHGVTPAEIGVGAVTNQPGYEMAELQLPAAEVVNHDRLFVRVAVPH